MDQTTDSVRTGLTSGEVEERIAAGKINGEQTVRTKSVGEIFRSNLLNFFNFVFTILAIILAFFVKFDSHGIGNFGFVIILISNAAIGIIQELKAKRTIDKLSLISAPKTKVIRDGEEKEIEVRDIVLDDVMILNAGDQICADATVISGQIEVNESLITGEPDAILKHPDDELMSGSFVVSGRAEAKVVHVGMDNFAMKISAGAKYFKKPNSEIWRSLMWIVKVMAAIIIPLGIAIFCVKFFAYDSPVNETVVNTIGSLIGMIPSGLVLLTSTVFCISVIRLSTHKTLAQDLYCVETLARVDVLCLDKTGTITEGSMEVHGIRPKKGGDEEYVKLQLKNLMSALSDENVTAEAVRTYVSEIQADCEAEATVPFSSARKWSGAFFGGRSWVLGAPEFVFPQTPKGVASVTEEMAQQGFRVLVLASSAKRFKEQNLPQGLRLEGYVFITDKIRAEAPDTLRFFREQGVEVKIISGDNPTTVRAVAMRAGVENCDSVIDMSTLKTEQEVIAAADKYTIFGRVLPDQKLTLVKALKSKGHTVAMTGDGVNDVLALKEADCSIAMASGSDAAKNVSSLVLLDSNFASMPKVVAEGRRSINNMERSASLFLVKTIYNFLIAIVFLAVPYNLPFEPRHLTLIGSVTIGIPSFLLALEWNDERVTGYFLPKVLSASIPGALTVVLGVIGVLFCHRFFMPGLVAEQASAMYVIITTFAAFIFLFRTTLPFQFKKRPLISIWHIVMILALVGIFVACHFIDLEFFDIRAFLGLSTNVNWEMGKALIVIAVILIPVFIALYFITKKIGDKIGGKIDAKLERLKKQPL